MTRFHTFALSVTTIIVLAAQSASLNAQAASPPSRVSSIAVSLTIKKDQVPVGQKPWAVLTIKNISQRVIGISTNLSFRIHIEGKGGEAPETEYHRHLHGDFRPGDGPALGGGPVIVSNLEVGAAQIQEWDLTMFYDLSRPGKYTVYIELYDPMGPGDGSGVWLRTNTVQFEIVPSSQ
jgi:hypothetical protein